MREMTSKDVLREFYKKELLKGIIEERTKKATGFRYLTNVTINKEIYKKVRRGARWLLTAAGVQYKLSDEDLQKILAEIGVNIEKEVNNEE